MRKVIVFVVIVLAITAFYFFGGAKYLSPQNEAGYQAVFLVNGQVYFGQMSHQGKWVVLRDVYYLEATDAPATLEGDTNPAQNIQLVKLGNELHGPEDEMFIDREKVVFWENMRADSRVVESIMAHKAGEN